MKRTLWLLLADSTHPDIHLVIPVVAWIAHKSGVEFECYLEAERDGRLFARYGSTVLGGMHHQQFNYLYAVFDVRTILFGETALFRSSLQTFNASILAEAHTIGQLYQQLLAASPQAQPEAVLVAPGREVQVEDENRSLELGPYLFPEIYFRRALALPPSSLNEPDVLALLVPPATQHKMLALYLSTGEQKALSSHAVEVIDTIRPGDDYGSVTLRIAERWKHQARGLAFGDPPLILSQTAAYCRDARVALYAEKQKLPPAGVRVSAYTEETSTVAEDVIRLANEIGNPVIVGRQTGDGDIFAWSKDGITIQITDPQRPAFPIVEIVAHTWTQNEQDLYVEEPDDETLRQYAREGRILATLLWHSGEMAHNEAMLNIFELAILYHIKMGIGVDAARYETSPQLWELLHIPRQKGGVAGLIEPVLHSGGMGVLAEVHCPPARLQQHCETALARIQSLAGAAATPRGYYAFMDADMRTLAPGRVEIYEAIAASGLHYVVSSSWPGRNRLIRRVNGCLVINQTCRSIAAASPFIRVSTKEEITQDASQIRPGWFIGTLDAPVIAFTPYIWEHGSQFMRIVHWLKNTQDMVNVLPSTIARYAHILDEMGVLPASE